MSASASAAKRGRRGARRPIQAAARPANSTMPSVESTESANDAESAAAGEAATTPAMHRPTAFRLDGRRRARNDVVPASVMSAARTADIGMADSTR